MKMEGVNSQNKYFLYVCIYNCGDIIPKRWYYYRKRIQEKTKKPSFRPAIPPDGYQELHGTSTSLQAGFGITKSIIWIWFVNENILLGTKYPYSSQ